MSKLIPISPESTSPIESEGNSESYAVGQWYWVPRKADSRDSTAEWLGCVMAIGSNYVELHSPSHKNGHRVARVHLDDAPTTLRREHDPHGVITGLITRYQGEVQQLMGEVQALTARLGFLPQGALQDRSGSQGTGLAVLSQQADLDGYKRALVKAQQEDLPALFEQIKVANENLAIWMSAEILPLQAMVGGMAGHLDAIKDRVFNVTLYAGLTEEVVQCTDGEPAAATEKLHIMQRRLCMDEECLIGYQVGGLDINDIGAFDAWLSLPENRDRLLPFPRTLIAMRVRRNQKDREWDGNLTSLFANIRLGNLDKLTFLYIRNGDQLFRLNTDLDFDEMIFPDKAMFDPAEPMMVKMFARSVEKMMTVREYEDRVREHEDRDRQHAAWVAEHPGENAFLSPFYGFHHSFRPSEWEPFADTNLYYDECLKSVADQIKRYNRIALIIQGLFDRSPVLHPHPPVKSWTADGFAAAIELVYDGSAVLHNGPPPDFEAYRAQCNAQITQDSVLYGQELFWEKKEAMKESTRLDNDWRNRSDWRPKTFRPHGNLGPGELARPDSWQPRAHKAVFSWSRERQTGDHWSGKRHGDPIRTTITVPVDELFNVSAYRPGDFKRFLQDSRTRAEYLKWAPMLLTAEEYHAGNRDIQAPVPALD
jgi:hypothetical protein